MDHEARIQEALDGVKNGKYKSFCAARREKGIAHTTLLYHQNGGQSY